MSQDVKTNRQTRTDDTPVPGGFSGAVERLRLRWWQVAGIAAILAGFVQFAGLYWQAGLAGLVLAILASALVPLTIATPRGAVKDPGRSAGSGGNTPFDDILQVLPHPAILLASSGTVVGYNAKAREYWDNLRRGSHLSSAIRQPLLLDAVSAYLPAPVDIQDSAVDLDNEEAPVAIACDPNKPTIALAFKLEDGRYGQLTYVRVYQGQLKKGGTIINSRTRKKHKVGRLVRMHADKMEDIDESAAGDIVALFGIECATGDTFCDESVRISMTSMHVPKPVISLSIKPKDNKAQDNMSKALGRFVREDPTFHAGVDPESGETVISGMGELHLDVYVERMKREYACEVETGAPQVAYRETISRRVDYNYTHKKQTGGSGQYGCVMGWVEPITEGDTEFEFLNEVRGGNVPKEYIPSVEKGFRSSLEKGRLIGFPVTGLRICLNDGKSHSVDSSDNAFQAAARGAFREFYPRAKPIILEPVMKVEVEGPVEFQGAMLKSIMQRRGTIVGTTEDDSGFARVESEVPLAEMFGYATDLRSLTQGKAEFSMEFSRYMPAPGEVQEELKKKYASKLVQDDD